MRRVIASSSLLYRATTRLRCASIVSPRNVHLSAFSSQDPLSTEPLPDTDPTTASASDPLKAAQDEIAKLRASLAEAHTGRMRLLADMENVRSIARRDIEQGKSYALQSFSKRLIDVVDNLSRAVDSVPADMRGKEQAGPVLYNLFIGVDATHRDFVKLLGQQGIEPFGKAGDKFDANRHEAMLEVPATDTTPAGTVAQVLKTGFLIKDRVLRAAQVTVAVKQQ